MKTTCRLAAATCAALMFLSQPRLGAADGAVGIGPSFKGPIGLQLYSLRGLFTRNVPETLAKVKAYGIRDVELAGTYNLPPEKFRALLDEHGLNPVSGHFPFERYKTDPEGVARDAKVLGLRYAGCAWISHEGDFDEAECREAIRVFNAAGAALAKEGIRFFYHAHGYEFQPQGDATLMDLLMKETDPRLVSYQMDTLWVFFPGQDPVAWLRKYPGRWELMHVKDLKKGVARGSQSGKTDPNNDVVLGTGQMDWPGILAEAAKQGVKYYFIEDESAAAADQIPLTLDYLEGVKW